MIEEIIGVGIKGQDVVLSELDKIQKKRDLVKQKSNLEMSLKTTGGGSDFARTISDVMTTAAQKSSRMKDIIPTTSDKVSSVASAIGQAVVKGNNQSSGGSTGSGDSGSGGGRGAAANRGIARGMQAIGSQDTSSLISALGTVSIMGTQVLAIPAAMANAAIMFKDKVKSAALIFEDSARTRSMSRGYAGEDRFLGRERSDISIAERRSVLEAIGSTYGKFSTQFSDSVKGLFGTGNKRFDVQQSTQIARGDFSGTGDVGFFLGKLSAGMQNLPPSMRQKLMPQLWSQLPDSERQVQSGELTGARSFNTGMDDMQRDQSARMYSMGAEQAKSIQRIQNQIDVGLSGAVSSMIGALNFLAGQIRSGGSAVPASAAPGSDSQRRSGVGGRRNMGGPP